MVRYVTLAYGDAPGVYRQSLMLLVSLVAHAPEPYERGGCDGSSRARTSGSARASKSSTRIRSLLEAWQGSAAVFDAPEACRCFAPRGRSQGRIVLLDADVLARRNLTPFVDGARRRPTLHAQAGVPVRPHAPRGQPRGCGTSLSGRTFGAVENHATDDAMWNSGVIGLGAPRIARSSTRRWQLYDAMGEAGVRHFATEQLVEGRRPRPHRPPAPGGGVVHALLGQQARPTMQRSPGASPTRSSRAVREGSGRAVSRAADRPAGGSAPDARQRSCAAGSGADLVSQLALSVRRR